MTLPNIYNTMQNAHFSSIDAIWTLLADDKNQLEAHIKQQTRSPIDLSNQVCAYITESGGKRIRPLVLLLLARALDYQGDKQFQLATAVEFIHTATLLHDDVVDGSERRRNRETANRRFGNAAAVLTGDFLYTRAFQLIAHELGAAKIISDATNELAMGEVMQLMNVNNTLLDEADYFEIIRLKTAVLFSAACEFAAVLGKASHLQTAFAAYGEHLGKAFQIADDLLDYTGHSAAIGKNLGDDLAERKLTLPLIHALKHADAADKANLLAIIEAGDRTRIAEVIAIIKKTDSVAYAAQIAFKQADAAKASLSGLPDSIYKTALLALPDLAVNRQN